MENSKKTSIALLALTGCMTLSSHAAVVINEIDYDQQGTDHAEFIELFNSGSSNISLDNYVIDLINGSNSSSYRNINLNSFNIDAGVILLCAVMRVWWLIAITASPHQMAGFKMAHRMRLHFMMVLICWTPYRMKGYCRLTRKETL